MNTYHQGPDLLKISIWQPLRLQNVAKLQPKLTEYTLQKQKRRVLIGIGMKVWKGHNGTKAKFQSKNKK